MPPLRFPEEIAVRRTDPIYMAHGYLTKVPVGAIVPFVEAFTHPGDLVADPFAGSGMTGVAAVMAGRRAALSDISKLGQHIGLNYVNLVDPGALRAAANSVLKSAVARVPNLYRVRCSHCDRPAQLVKAIWSKRYTCPACCADFTYYDALQAGGWLNAQCPHCDVPIDRRGLPQTGEAMVREAVRCVALPKQVEQDPSDVEVPRFPQLERWPDVPIPPHSEMFRRSALNKHGLTTTACFFSVRNLTALVALRDAIRETAEPALRHKLMFAFTAILPRSSKRYQWSRKRPLNAQNQTYYVSPVFYEWNVFDLFERKVSAVVASDDAIRHHGPLFAPKVDASYDIASADDLRHIESASVDYVFTDPPFGSNIFYSDMNLFQEVWLDSYTDSDREAVITTNGDKAASALRYESIMAGALRECYRILKPAGWLSMVFSNSRGDVWALVQRALKNSGLELVPDCLSSINKGQRSVKGLTSGWEAVVTTDLVLTARKPEHGYSPPPICPPAEPLAASVESLLAQASPNSTTPSRVYLDVIRLYIRNSWDLERLHFQDVLSALGDIGYRLDRATGRILSS